MARQNWRRIREQAAQTPPFPDAPNTWAPPPDDPNAVAGAGEDQATDPTKVAEYFAWAERLRAKKARAQQATRSPADQPAEPSYWSTESVFAESRRVEQEEAVSGRASPATDLAYATLGLDAGASLAEITDAYRSFAKQHHPDRYSGADAATQRFHADRMQAVNEAYRVLRAAQDR